MMSAPRKIAIKLMSAVVRYSSDESREWASAMLQELDFIDSDWEALFWTLGARPRSSGIRATGCGFGWASNLDSGRTG